jgi:MFS family permease
LNTIATLYSLLLSTVLLLIGHGMQLTLLPLRAASLGHSELQIAFGGSAYFAGFVLGCLVAPRAIARVGHIRSFAVLASVMGSVLLFVGLSDSWLVWACLRALVGVAICGLYTVIESWLNDQATPENRGQILSVYTAIVLTGMAGGQLLVNLAPVTEAMPFMLLAAVLALSVIPVGLTRSLAPAPIESTRSRIRFLFRRAPTAAIGAVAAGAITGSFWSLGAVFARQSFASLEQVTLFMAATILGGALFQYLFGWLSDRVGRNTVLLLLGALGTASSLAVVRADGAPLLLAAAFAFGACVMPMYSMALAVAADNSLRHEFVEVGTSVLLLNALGAVLAPLAVGQLIAVFGPAGLFVGCAAFSASATLCFLILFRRKPLVDDVAPFSVAATDRAPTSFDLDPRAPEEGGDLTGVAEAPSLIDEAGADATIVDADPVAEEPVAAPADDERRATGPTRF